ncbi:MAG TPA: glycosyltransferase family 2 protein [Candidatus Limnocylindria bacterium]|nr:glycosyltransferase family 2 protein [Candidatus Limnocylindria bacterium]
MSLRPDSVSQKVPQWSDERLTGSAPRSLGEQDRELAIVVLNYNSGQDLLHCVESILKSGGHHRDIIVVDNASVDESLSLLVAQHPNLVYLRSSHNGGFTQGNNLGLRYAEASGYRYVLIINPDVELNANALSELFRAAKAYSNGAIICPAVYEDPGFRIANFLGTKPVTDRSLLSWYRLHFRFWDLRIPQHPSTETCRIHAFWGCCFIVNLDAAGAGFQFDSKLFLHGVEAEVTLRACKNGASVVYVPGARICHVGGVTRQETPRRVYLINQGLCHAARQNLPPVIFGAFWLELLWANIRSAGRDLLEKRRFTFWMRFRSLVDPI